MSQENTGLGINPQGHTLFKNLDIEQEVGIEEERDSKDSSKGWKVNQEVWRLGI